MNFVNCCFPFTLLRKWWYMSMSKSSTFTESSLALFPANKCAKWQRQPTSNMFSSPFACRIFWRRLLLCPIVEIVLSKRIRYAIISNESASLTSLRTSYICCAAEPLLIFGMSSNDVAISPKSLSTCLTKTDKNFITASIYC